MLGVVEIQCVLSDLPDLLDLASIKTLWRPLCHNGVQGEPGHLADSGIEGLTLRLSGKHYRDGAPTLPLFGLLPHDDFDIHPQFGQESDQTFLGVTLEVTT